VSVADDLSGFGRFPSKAPITVEDVLNSPQIACPFRLPQRWPKAVARWFLVSAERARDFLQSDIDHPTIYGAFADLPIYGLEDLGIVPRGEAGAFIVERNTATGGKPPLNTMATIFVHAFRHARCRRACVRCAAPPRPDPNISVCHGSA
jgi:hypothetical protein